MGAVGMRRSMVMLSRFLHAPIVDRRGHRASLADVAVDPNADCPPVTRIVYRQRGMLVALPWQDRSGEPAPHGVLNVGDLDTGEPVAPEAAAREVWLRRDVLDALLIDVVALRTLRANDVWLEVVGGRLSLRAVDGSAWGIVRRLTHGLVNRDHNLKLVDWTAVEFLRGDPAAAARGAAYLGRIRRLPPGEIARLIEFLPYLHAVELLLLLPESLAAHTLESMTPERQVQVIEELEDTSAVRLIAHMPPDAAADLIARLAPDTARRYLQQMPPAARDRVVELLRYPADVAGGIMTNELIAVPATLTVAAARQALRQQLAAPELAYYVYVVDNERDRRLRGVLTLRTLLLADDAATIEDVMDPYLVAVNPLEPAARAAQRVVDNQLFALPVVASDGRLVGAVTVDAAVATIAPANWRAQAPRVFS